MDVYETKTFENTVEGNTYPGRGIIIGKSEDGKKQVTAYFIMGRSQNSRNRVFLQKGQDLMIKAFDESKLQDPSLIIYYPVRINGSHMIVTNGDQTDTVDDFLNQGKTFEQALMTREFEPDAPNFTPRISGIVDYEDGDFSYRMSILKSGDREGSCCNRFFYNYRSVAGLGHFIHTYVCDGNPIPTFQGEPEKVRIPNDIDSFTDEIWSSLDSHNKVSLYVAYTHLETGKRENRIVNINQ